ncbi:inositol-pentakisphosphate 2-kinase isoform X2 [Diachasmimorpha longicaudata]|uniref:inositol-pentakisphosphate 2-kinase isoform X2 n=1 Tax=Diachasmimorpha longicaudata TaxID=58733 RepID=UPI0030B90706
MELIIRQLEASHMQEYTYRGEGNANLVISLPLAKSVLRFHKIEPTKESPIDAAETKALLEFRFFMKFISKLMGRFVTPPEILRCHPNNFRNWDERVEILRPAARKHKNCYHDLVIKLPDYAKLPDHLDIIDTRKPTFCIEIKPKQGFMPRSERRTHLCPYCTKQFYKLINRAVNKRSRDGQPIWGEGYPRDNLDEILNEWLNDGSQKDSQQLLNELYVLVEEALYREFTFEKKNNDTDRKSDDIITIAPTDMNHSTFDGTQTTNERACNFPDGNLPKDSILGRLFQVQQLHSSSAQHVYRIYSQHSTHLNEEMVYFTDSSEYKGGENSIAFNDILILRNYLLFTTARDCSVMLTFRQIDPRGALEVPPEHLITGINQSFVFNIAVTDIDPKPLNRIDRHRRRAITSFNIVANC